MNSPSPTTNKTFRFEKQPRRCKTSLENHQAIQNPPPPLPSNPPAVVAAAPNRSNTSLHEAVSGHSRSGSINSNQLTRKRGEIYSRSD